MTVNSIVVKYLKKYSELFENKWDVLEHIFCVIGNEFAWQGGEIVFYYAPEKQLPLPRKMPSKAKDMKPTKEGIYPLWKGSKIVAFPEDIKPDWREAIQEFIETLTKDNGVFLSEEDKKWVKYIKEKI